MEFSRDNIPVSIRLNPFKPCDTEHLDFAGEVPWSEYGRYLKERPVFTLDPLFHAGAYYVQDASAMFPGYVFRRASRGRDSRRVLDLCAAPGGKSTDLAASLRQRYGNGFVLVCNETIRSRAAVLADNVALWGEPNAIVTSSDPKSFGSLPGRFGAMMADVPCSGEGMFRKSLNARRMWSDDNVALCTARARRIVADAWDCLAPGGLLIFSTCTLNEEENDGNADWICSRLGASPLDVDVPFDGIEKTRYGYLLVPGKVRGEGQYCAALVKDGPLPEDRNPAGREAENGTEFFEKNGEIFALTPFAARQMRDLGKALKVLNAGIRAFTVKGRDRIPCADLALGLIFDGGDFPTVELNLNDALKFLHKDTLVLPDAPPGYVTVTFKGLPLGFVKNLGDRANNLHPASRKIIMDINTRLK